MVRRRRCLGVLALACGWTGCAAPTEKLSHYPPPIFTTIPKRTVPIRERPAPAREPFEERRVVRERGWIPPQGLSRRWKDIVIHHSASHSGSASVFDDFHRNVRKWDELGYHFVIGNGTQSGDGQVEIGSRWTKQKHGAHCKTPDNHFNDHGVGICLVGDFNDTYPTPAQLASLNRLLTFLTRQCRIPASRVHTHEGVTHKTQCPGRRFSLAAVKRDLVLSGSLLSKAESRSYRQVP